MRLFTLLLAAASIAALGGEASCPVQDASSQSPDRSLLQVRTDASPNRTSIAKAHVDLISRLGQNPRQPHVCILARTCGPHSSCAPPGDPALTVQAFLASIVGQAYSSWELHLINGQGGGEVFQDVVAKLGDSRLSNGPSSPDTFSSNSWGYDATNYAIDKILDDTNANAPCEYFLFTNADNMYGRGFLETGLPGMLSGLDLLGFNFVSRYTQNNGMIREHMPMVHAGFTQGHIDLGAALVSANAMKESGIRFSPTHNEITDWKFFEAVLQRANGKGSTFYPELHYIHQF